MPCHSPLGTENQRNEHASAAIKRREPNINNLVSSYNKLCQRIATLIAAKQAPRGTVAPLPVPTKGIYQLDVDDIIWQDLGLTGDEESMPPLWLSNDKVRSGIRAMLQKDRCEEEALRSLRERQHLQTWFRTEWEVVCEAISLSEGVSFKQRSVSWVANGDQRPCAISIRAQTRRAIAALRPVEKIDQPPCSG